MRKRMSTLTGAAVTGLALIAAGSPAPAAPASAADGAYTIRAGSLRIGLDGSGTVTGLVDADNGRDYASGTHRSPLLKLVVDGKQALPTSLSYNKASSTYTFTFGDKGVEIGVRAASKAGYATLEVTSVEAPSGVDVQTLLWGPITTSISKTVGETVGVVRDDDFAMGIHGLNDKTVGGWPDEFDKLSHPDGPTKVGIGNQNWPFGWFSASQTHWGSILQAYTYDYTKTRHRYVGWSDTHEPDVPVQPLSGDDALIKGSKIALFGTAPGTVLNTLSRIETGEGLVHTKVDGQWGKTSQGSSQSFLVLGDLNTGDAAEASKYARRAGMRYIYSLPGVDGPWKSAGHNQFNSAFGGSDEGAAELAATAAAGGQSVGVHTLANLVDTNDPYVTPVPSKGLATMGTVKLTRPLAADAKTAYVDGDSVFSGGNEKVLRIGDELLTYSAVHQLSGSSTEYEVTLDARQKWGTTAAAQPAGAELTRMQRYGYGQFVAGMPLIPEMAGRFAQIFNSTGIKAMSFDGLETATLTGHGTFATNKLVNGMYRKIEDTDDFLSEASNVLPGTWDAVGRASWGEGPLANSLQKRYDHQLYFQRNYLPNMMGWVSYSPKDSVLSQEWQLSKMAGFNAGAGLQASVSALKSSGNTAGVLDAWKEWEAARNAHAFTDQQMTAMKNPDSYWHLENTAPGKEWNLYDIAYPANALNAPNDGSTSTWQYTNTHQAQALQFQLQAADGAVTDPSFTLGGTTLTFHTTVPSGGYLVADGTSTAKVYDSTWHQIDTVTPGGAASYTTGEQTIGYHASGSTGSTAKIRFLTKGAPQKITAPLTVDTPATTPGGTTTTVTSTYTNHSAKALKDLSLNLTTPKGWKAEPASRTTFRTVASGRTVTVSWKVTPPANAAGGDRSLPVQAMYEGARTGTEAVGWTAVRP